MPTADRSFRPAGHDALKQQAARQYDATEQRRADHAFYNGKRWRDVRAVKLTVNPVCEDCLLVDAVTVANQVDHVQDRKTHPELSYTMSNLRSLCQSHHSSKTAKTRAFGRAKR